MAGITLSEDEVKNLLFALASARTGGGMMLALSSKHQDDSGDKDPEGSKPDMKEDKSEDGEEEDAPLDSAGRVDTKEMLRRKLEKGKK